ncbi:MAG: GvpL/GvpF family gas vesicle protein, partial [Chloroflexota bacterium]|nr:GvpL/GvpF family gas vesicle protein [Chloroflexota bacterium]
ASTSPRMAVRATYLVAPPGIDGFRAAFEALRASMPDLHFLLTGPWPPYSFVTLPESGSSTASLLGLLQAGRSLPGAASESQPSPWERG